MRIKNFEIVDDLGGICKKQTGLFTPKHEKHYLKITIKDLTTGEKAEKRTFYQYNPQATIYEDGDGVLAVVNDALCYADCPGFLDFCREFGYSTSSPKARGAFKACKNSLDFFESVGLRVDDLVKIQEKLDF